MLYDVFVSHASEDKDDFVRPLAQRLRAEHLEVWYDEFTLNVGDSLRRSIDRGLSQSRFGLVVLSPSFFGKQWSQWELDGLVARQNSGQSDVILPIWHKVGRDDVLAYSPPLADRVAISSARGLDEVVEAIARVVRPRGSTLVFARDYLIDKGTTPPVISDDWWLNVAAAAESNPMEGDFQESMGWGKWGFPLPPRSEVPEERGLRLAWAALQMAWQSDAEARQISQVTHPDLVHEFIGTHPGLEETCHDYLHYVVVYAPQLTIRGFGGAFENEIDLMYKRAVERTGRCDEDLALRLSNFDGYDLASLACGFVQGNSVVNGPPVRHYETIDYAIWLLSAQSAWLPNAVRDALTRGMAAWAVWPWHGSSHYEIEHVGFHPIAETGSLTKKLYRARRLETFRLTRDARRDLEHRIGATAAALDLPEPPDELADRFLEAGFIEQFFRERRRP
jgi:TIR domain